MLFLLSFIIIIIFGARLCRGCYWLLSSPMFAVSSVKLVAVIITIMIIILPFQVGKDLIEIELVLRCVCLCVLAVGFTPRLWGVACDGPPPPSAPSHPTVAGTTQQSGLALGQACVAGFPTLAQSS